MLDIGISLGSLLIIPTANSLADAVGWRGTYTTVGLATVAFACAWHLLAADAPSQCWCISAAELTLTLAPNTNPNPSLTRTRTRTLILPLPLPLPLPLGTSRPPSSTTCRSMSASRRSPSPRQRRRRRAARRSLPRARAACGVCWDCRATWRWPPVREHVRK